METPTPIPDALAIINKFEEQIKAVEEAHKRLATQVAEAEKSADWGPVEDAKRSLQTQLSVAKSTQRKLEGGSETETISASYVYKDEKGQEKSETIEISFESTLGTMADLYQKYGIDIPANFTEQMQDVWERNADAMMEAIAEKGFNQALFIPAELPKVAELEKKLTVGYDKEKGNDTYWGVKAEEIKDSRLGGRIILLHNALDLTAHSELQKTLGKKAQDFQAEGEALTLSEYLILQRDVFDKTGVHLDSNGTPDGSYIYWTWLPGSTVGSGVVCARWDPVGGRLRVGAGAPGFSDPDLGCRRSRCFQ